MSPYISLYLPRYVFLFMTFFFFPPVSKRIFSTLHCAEMRPGEYFLWEDLVRVTLTLTF